MRGDGKTADNVKSRLMKIRVMDCVMIDGARHDRRRAFITTIVGQ